MTPANENDANSSFDPYAGKRIILQCLLSALALGFFVWANAWVYGG